jgi:hypothetical protein
MLVPRRELKGVLRAVEARGAPGRPTGGFGRWRRCRRRPATTKESGKALRLQGVQEGLA